MHLSRFAVAAIAVLAAAAPTTPARADCTEDPRQVSLDKKNAVRLKSYSCQSGQDTFRVEFNRFSERAASLLVAKRMTEVMRRTFGNPKLVENEVFGSYAELLKRFGVNQQMSGNLRGQSTLTVGRGIEDQGGGIADDTLPSRTIRTILGSQGTWGADYPAHEEIAAFRKKSIPPGMRFTYTASCLDEYKADMPLDVECKKFNPDSVRMNFWRPMRRDDLDNYAKNVAAYNRSLAQFKAELKARREKLHTDEPLKQENLTAKLSFFRFLAGDSWPEDFLIIAGGEKDTCGEDTVAGIDGWAFSHSGRNVFLDAILIQNTSKRPLAISALFGGRATEPRLRRPDSSVPTADATIASMSETLAPGQRILVPIRILLESEATHDLGSPKQSKQLFDREGMRGFSGLASGHAFPQLPDYTYGPELNVRAIQVNDRRVDFTRPAANFIDLSITPEVGSCPYLLSWDSRSGEWLDHGKVLHLAPSREREYTDTRTVEGFASRFRLEEREAELAHIDHVELVVRLTSGEVLTLKSDIAAIAARDRDYLRLFWGDSADITFALPDGVAEHDVAESTLNVTGYYERYSALMARNAALDDRSRRTAAALRGDTTRSSAQVCPAPARPSRRLSIRTL